ncbi:MAG: hypothetical protein ACXWKG_02470 [Limisphaerales bacterium]
MKSKINRFTPGVWLFVGLLLFNGGMAKAITPLFDSEMRLVASDASVSNRFGTSVAISDGTAAVWSLDSSNDLAATYIYQFNGTTWVQSQKLEPPTPFRGFLTVGDKMVDIDGHLLVMGAPPRSDNAGPAFIFARFGGAWVLQATIDRGILDNDLFGAAVSISGQTVAIGAPTSDIVTNEGGAVYIYVQTGTNWVQQALLTAPDASLSGKFGQSVALDGNTLLVGARDTQQSGAVYVFVRVGANWVFQAKLKSNVPEFLATFGSSVALSGDTAVVGNPENNLNAEGDVFVFVRTNGSWSLQQRIRPADVLPPNSFPINFFFGNSVAIKNDVLVIGAPGSLSGLGNTPANAAYVFTRSNGTWVETQTLVPTNPQVVSGFGASVDVDLQALIVGSPLEDSPALDAGAAYAFTRPVPVVLSANATPNVLFPPNHQLVPVTINITSQGEFASCKIISVTSNEPINGRGDGNTSPDWIITGDLALLLRAERSGPNKNGRIYTITVQCTDALGNSTTTNVLVTVPHDNGNK